MLIYLDPKTYQFLGTYILKKGDIELETRFGRYENGNFKPDIGKDSYDTISTYLQQHKDLIHRIEKEDSKVEIYNYSNESNNTRRIRKITFDQKNILYQTKTKIYTGDIEYKDFVLRLSESEEITIPKPDTLNNPIETRERQRTIYYHYSNIFYYVLTKVTTETEVTYELEIEYRVSFETLPYLIRMVQDSVNHLLPILVKDKERYSYVSLSEESYVKDSYSYLYIKEPKPVNLNRYITPELQSMGYSLTNKLDGERFILVFTKSGFYAFNHRKIEKYNSNNYNISNTLNDSFIYYALDAEFFEGKYYIFDCMIYEGENITDRTHEDRLKDAERIVISLSIPNYFLNLKTFYRGDLKKHTEKLLETLSKEKNDGLIYTSNQRYYSNIYKWKFPDKMTIDFCVYKIGDKKYELYVKDNIEGFPVNVPFRGNSTYELSEAIYNSKEILKEGGIYEFGYDNDNESFILFRDRPDKIDPNYITVAQNVWNDIKNPYTSDELIHLLSPKVLDQYRKYQNSIKRSLIEEYCNNKNVLDLGSGRGGDLGKYDSALVNYLWCVEPNEKNYTELLRRLSERKTMKNKTTLIKTVAQDSDKIVNGIRQTVVYDSPISFSVYVKKVEFNDRIKPFLADHIKNVDHLKTVISDVINLDKNSFIVYLSKKDEILLSDEYLFENYNNEIEVMVRYPVGEERQDLGKDFKNWFPRMENVNYDQLMITEEGMYSLTKNIDSLSTIQAMKNIIGEENLGGLTILDGTANVGGDTIRFAMNFDKVISVEMDKENYKVLSNNVNVYHFENKVTLINGDITKVYETIYPCPEVLYLDPPWGGKGYKDFDEEKMVLFLSNMSLTKFIANILLSPNCPSYIFIKLPMNYYIDSLKNMPSVRDMHVYEIRKFYLVCLVIDKNIKKADVLSSFFSLSFFFFRDENGSYMDLDHLVDTIDRTTKDGGCFIGTTIDGDRTRKLLSSLPDKKFDFEGGYIRIMNEEKDMVELLIKDTIVETQIESFVNFDLLQMKLYDKGFYLEKSEIFSNSELLTEKENILNSLYRTFVFRKMNRTEWYKSKAMDFVNKTYSSYKHKSPLKTNEICNALSLNIYYDQEEKCMDSFDELLDKKMNLQNYLLFNFNYIPDWTRLLVSKKYDYPINVYKEYYNGVSSSQINDINGILTPNGMINHHSIVSYNIDKKKKILGDISLLFGKFGDKIDVMISCLYQLYNSSSLLKSNGINLINPVLLLSEDKRVESVILDQNPDIKIKVVDGIELNILNYSYSYDSTNLYDYDSLFPYDSLFNYTLIEIIKYLDRSYQKRIYNDILKIEKSDLITFLIDFMEIDKKYNDLSTYHLVKVNKGGEIINALNSSIFYIKERLSKRYQKIDELTDNEFELFENVSKISKIMKTKKVSNKVYKWLEILSLCCSSDKNYTVFSNGYMPKMFLEAMKCYLSIHYDDFKWHSNTNDDIDNIPMEKCVNALDIETSDIENITYIENKLKRKIDIYSTYSNKDDDSIKRFIGDILFGLVTLKENGIMLFNMKSFFTPIQVSIIGIIMDMFEVRIVKPYFSSITESEVYFICENYKRDDSKIKILRDLLMVDSKDYYYIPNSMDMNKYSSLLLAAYTYYGRQIYFMDMDMHLYETYKSYGVKDKDDIKSMKDVKDKFISYYTQKRLEWNKELKKIKDTFTIRKWNNHKCKKNVKKDKQKIKRWGSLSSNAPSFSKNIDSYIGLK